MGSRPPLATKLVRNHSGLHETLQENLKPGGWGDGSMSKDARDSRGPEVCSQSQLGKSQLPATPFHRLLHTQL